MNINCLLFLVTESLFSFYWIVVFCDGKIHKISGGTIGIIQVNIYMSSFDEVMKFASSVEMDVQVIAVLSIRGWLLF